MPSLLRNREVHYRIHRSCAKRSFNHCSVKHIVCRPVISDDSAFCLLLLYYCSCFDYNNTYLLKSANCLRKDEVFIGKKKVKCTVVQALRFCTGRTAHRGSRGLGKGKVYPCTGTEVLYRPYGPQGE